MPRPCRPCFSPSGFSLVELLIVIFIIALIGLLILGAVHRSKKTAAIAKTRADFSAIATALEQYKSDFKNYPGLPESPTGMLKSRSILAAALIGPGSEAEDGANGSGFRTTNPATGALDLSSKIWPAYLSPDKFQVRQFTHGGTGVVHWAILDHFGNPIRYYPKRRNFNPKLGPIVGPFNSTPGMFDFNDGEHPQFGFDLNEGRCLDGETLLKYLGDDNINNLIDPPSQPPAPPAPGEVFNDVNFILASSGPDGRFNQLSAEKKLEKTDDILNVEP